MRGSKSAAPSRLVIVGDLRVPRVVVAIESLPVGMRLTIDASPQTPSTLTRDGDHLTVKFDADALDTTLPAVPPQPFLQALRQADAVTLAVDLGPRFGTYRSSTQTIDTTARVLVELLPSTTETAPRRRRRRRARRRRRSCRRLTFRPSASRPRRFGPSPSTRATAERTRAREACRVSSKRI